MKWTEVSSKNERRAQIKEYIISKFKEIYDFFIFDSNIEFKLNDGTMMKVVSLGGTHFDSLVMSYKNDDDDDDGDVFDIDDYESPDELFNAMLAETKR